MSALLSCRGIGFAYAKESVLREVDLELEKGEFCAIIGPNGGGKSTLGKIIVGLLEPRSGEVRFLGKKRRSLGLIGYVPQDTSLNKEFPIRAIDVVLMGFLPHRGISEAQRARALEALEALGIKELAYRRIGDLSGGQRQRVLIARALVGEPELLVLDEPTASIDAPTQKEIYQLLKEQSQQRGVIVISHDVSLLMGYATKALYINREGVMHTLEEIRHALPSEGHWCEVEFLHAFGREVSEGRV